LTAGRPDFFVKIRPTASSRPRCSPTHLI
jgi:hypothetical protein